MKKYFLTGFVSLLPLALTLMIGLWLFNLFTAPIAGLMEYLVEAYESSRGLSIERHALLLTLVSRLVGFIILLCFIFLIGFCGQKFLAKTLQKTPEKIFSRIPLVRTIFRLSSEVTKAVFSDTKKTFQETVLVPFPHENALAVGFVTGETPPALKETPFLTDFAIFVPTAPHPMSGFILLSPKKDMHHVDVSVEDAFKFLISCGVIHPGEAVPSEEKNHNAKYHK